MTSSNDGTRAPATYDGAEMNAELERQAESLFQELADAPAGERARRLQEAVPELSKRVRRLLELHDAACEPGLRTPVFVRQAGTFDSSLLPTPKNIGPYTILKTLGEGGMGVVYLAEQLKPIHRTVALKVIKLGMDTKAIMARFEAEREALALMGHPNVARVIDAGATEEGRPYFVMEYVEGVPITQFCDRQRLSVADRLDLFMQVCHAVQHAHQKGIIHRDLKPSNVLVTMVDTKPAVKVIDFGIAKATQQRLTDLTIATQQGLIVGTPAYMSPEQADPAAHDIDTRADIYSLGVILYELLVGVLPLDADTMRKIALSEAQRLIREVDPPRPSSRISESVPAAGADAHTKDIAGFRQADPKSLLRQIRGDLDWIVMKCLEKDRTRRYETANDLAMELQRYLRQEPVAAGPPSRTYRARKFVRRNKGPVIAAAMVLIALSVGLVGTTLMFARAKAAEGRERDQRLRAEEGETKAEKARVQSDQAREEAEQVTQFLTGMLASVDPGQQGKDVTVREVVDKAATNLTAKFSEKPVIEARLQATIGETYRSLGLEEAAQKHITRAHAVYVEALGPEHQDTLKTANNVAIILQQRGQYLEAEAILRQTLEIQLRLKGEEHAEVRRSMHNLANNLWYQGRFPEAEQQYRRSFEIAQRTLGREHQNTLRVMGNLAYTIAEMGRYEEATVLHREALEIRARVLGNDHPETLWSIQSLATCLHLQGHFAEAEDLCRQVAEARERVLGLEHPDTLTSMINLAIVLHDRGRFADAEQLRRQTLEKLRRVRGETHPHTLECETGLAASVYAQGRHEEAEALYRKVLEPRRLALGPNHPGVAETLEGLALVLAKTQRYTEAEIVCREASSIVTARFPPEHRVRRLNASLTGDILCGLERYAEAEPLLVESYEALREDSGVPALAKQEMLHRLVRLYDSWDSAHPGQGHAAKAQAYRVSLEQLNSLEDQR